MRVRRPARVSYVYRILTIFRLYMIYLALGKFFFSYFAVVSPSNLPYYHHLSLPR